MPQIINTNISALNAQRNLNKSQASGQLAMQRLSSGLRINSAKDDSAGLSISTRMSAQISGNTQAARNANDGISLAQTAEGSLAEVGNNLQRIRDLSVQSANSTNSASDRVSMQTEVTQLLAEIDRVAQNSSFNGIKLLDGSFVAQNFQVGANGTANDTIQVSSIASARTTQLGGIGTTTQATVTGTATTTALAAGDLTLNGQQVGASSAGALPGQAAASAIQIAVAINTVSAESGVTAIANATTATQAAAPTIFGSVAANSFSVNGVNVGTISAGGNAVGQGANVAAAINKITSQSGVSASANVNTGAVTLSAADGRDITISTAYAAESTTAKATALNTALASKIGFAVGTGASTTVTNALVAGVNGTATSTWALAASQGSIAANTVSITTAAGTYALGAVDLTGTANQNATNLSAAINAATGATVTSNATPGSVTIDIAFAVNVLGVAATAADATANQATVLAQFGTASGAGTVGKQASVPLVATATIAAAASHGTITLNSSNAAGIVASGGAIAKSGLTAGTTSATTVSSVSAISSIDISTAAGATAALSSIDGATNTVNTARGNLGALQNRFTSTVNNLQSTTENLSASRSRIQDADFAAESAELSRSQVLQQAGTAMLAQANQSSQGVMALLR